MESFRLFMSELRCLGLGGNVGKGLSQARLSGDTISTLLGADSVSIPYQAENLWRIQKLTRYLSLIVVSFDGADNGGLHSRRSKRRDLSSLDGQIHVVYC